MTLRCIYIVGPPPPPFPPPQLANLINRSYHLQAIMRDGVCKVGHVYNHLQEVARILLSSLVFTVLKKDFCIGHCINLLVCSLSLSFSGKVFQLGPIKFYYILA